MIELQTEQRITSFLNHLQNEGYQFGIAERKDIFTSLIKNQQLRKASFKHIIQSLVCQNEKDWKGFDQQFESFWYPGENHTEHLDAAAIVDPRLRSRQNLVGLAGVSDHPDWFKENNQNAEGAGAAKQSTIGKADFRFITNRRDLRVVERLADRLALRLKTLSKRKYTLRATGRRINIRRTVRSNMQFAGLPLRPLFDVKAQQHPHIVILHDISFSMSWNNPVLFRFCRGLVNAFRKSHVYAFHTELLAVTHLYRSSSLKQMQEKLEADTKLKMGGTCIARSINEFLNLYGKHCLTSKSIVMIISDGFDTDEPHVLHESLQVLSEKSKTIMWLNPMLGRENVKITESDLLSQYPAVDAFLPANNINGLKMAVDFISKNK